MPITNADKALATQALKSRVRLAQLQKSLIDSYQERQDIIEAMRDAGWGYDRIAQAFGLSKSRAQQLVP